jgi:hypothetical protein
MIRKALHLGLGVAILFLLPTTLLAHGPEAELLGITVEVTPLEALEGDEAPIEAHITKEGDPITGLEVIVTIDRHESEESHKFSTKEREPGHYFTKYKFEESGEYEVHIEFEIEGEKIRTTKEINVLQRSGNDVWYFGIGALILIAITWGLIIKAKKKNIKRAIVLTIVITFAAFLGYSLYQVYITGARSAGVVTCPSESVCYLTAHIHAFVPTEVCGEDIRYKTEVGSLEGPHTHEEKNIIHWHDRLPYDKIEKKLLDTEPLTLGAFFDAIEVPFSSTHILDKQNGDACTEGIGTLKMFVNGVPSDAFREYVWTDKDVIHLFFDSRDSNEIETFLQQDPVIFPSLGRG